jgi:ApaG protein
MITDGNGKTVEVKGPGVVGEQPKLRPSDSYTYSSGCPLPTPSGLMVGTYDMMTASGEHFDAAIPAFSLDSHFDRHSVN